MPRPTPDELAGQISSFLNCMGNDREMREAAAKVANDHRTLQQKFARFCLFFFEAEAEAFQAGRYDLRNQATGELAAAIMALPGRTRALPHI